MYLCSEMDRFLTTIRDFIAQNNLPTPPSRIVIGVSGGADSVCLLRVMTTLGYGCIAVHCNFHLRGAESNRDEQFVRELCTQLDIELRCVSFDTAEYASKHHIGIEQAARTLRYSYFNDQLTETCAIAIAVAHHRDDNVETMLWNMVRGTGIRGLRGMLPQNSNIIRPLLCVSRAEILKYLARMGQDYVTDSTNLIDDVTRNKIRLNIIPQLQSLNPAAVQNISQMMSNMQEVWKIYRQYIDLMSRRCITKYDDHILIDLSHLSDCPSITTVLHEILAPMGFNRHQIDGMLKAESGKLFTSSAQPGLGTIKTARIKSDRHGHRIIITFNA